LLEFQDSAVSSVDNIGGRGGSLEETLLLFGKMRLLDLERQRMEALPGLVV
jgi:hypothetical protein